MPFSTAKMKKVLTCYPKVSPISHKHTIPPLHAHSLTNLPPADSSSYQQSSLMVSESDTEEEVLFDTAKKGQPAPPPVPTVKNNKLTAGDKYGKNSSLANSVIPK